ncbi:DUF6489 family protein [Fodinicurvata sp. EGI_FJ10296]|uniref:DUF6489 family protein n=1 Tax=Fodinicurvata sp. EGI_FJ10296 TaxID=3231908 RepID=UPI003453AF2E
MNIRIDIECTPEEARTFLGLPEIKPLQDAMIEQMRQQIPASMTAMDPETLMKTWMPMSLQGLEQMNRAVWDAMNQSARSGSGSRQTSDDEKPESDGTTAGGKKSGRR